jgi:hypothetical protein
MVEDKKHNGLNFHDKQDFPLYAGSQSACILVTSEYLVHVQFGRGVNMIKTERPGSRLLCELMRWVGHWKKPKHKN